MRYLSFIFLIILFASCNHSQGDIEISGTAPGVKYGNLVIRDQANSNIFTGNIEEGKFDIGKKYLQFSGYYKMLFGSKETKGTLRRVEVYLEPGTYNIAIDTGKINDYPKITTSSKIQTELSAYYAIADSMSHTARQKVVAINAKMQEVNGRDIKSQAQTDTLTRLQAEEMRSNQVDPLSVFNIFIARYPESEAAAHLMAQLDYQNDPVTYYKIFQKFSDAAKNSDDGKELEAKLKPLTSLAAGSVAPRIAGNTPDGEELDIKAMHKKVILIDFWRSSNGSSRDNHREIITQLLQLSTRGFGAISVSFDTDKDKWTNAIMLDKMKWTQISDLKGDDSPNREAWGIKSIPAYYLLDGDGRIITRIAEFADVPQTVDKYLQSH